MAERAHRDRGERRGGVAPGNLLFSVIAKLDFIHFGYEALSINTLGSDPVPEVFECRVKYPTFKNVSH
jgi:hypothetical protein